MTKKYKFPFLSFFFSSLVDYFITNYLICLDKRRERRVPWKSYFISLRVCAIVIVGTSHALENASENATSNKRKNPSKTKTSNKAKASYVMPNGENLIGYFRKIGYFISPFLDRNVNIRFQGMHIIKSRIVLMYCLFQASTNTCTRCIFETPTFYKRTIFRMGELSMQFISFQMEMCINFSCTR